MSVRIAPSILSADLGRLREQVDEATAGGADWLHIDVMDGHFVPNLTFGAPIIRALRRFSTLPLDVHLMVEHPERYLEEYAEAGAAVFAFHPEATVHVQRHLVAAREHGMRAGLVFNPSTPIAIIEEVKDDLDLILVMSVNPGYGGQRFLPAAIDKVARIHSLCRHLGVDPIIEIDGGITPDTIGAVHRAGADTFVAGTAVFGQPDIAAAIHALRRACAVIA